MIWWLVIRRRGLAAKFKSCDAAEKHIRDFRLKDVTVLRCDATEMQLGTCEDCGQLFVRLGSPRRKRFCNGTCRQRWNRRTNGGRTT